MRFPGLKKKKTQKISTLSRWLHLDTNGSGNIDKKDFELVAEVRSPFYFHSSFQLFGSSWISKKLDENKILKLDFNLSILNNIKIYWNNFINIILNNIKIFLN